MRKIDISAWDYIIKRQIVIFSAGKKGKNVLRKLQYAGCANMLFVDNNKEKQGTYIDGIHVLSLESIENSSALFFFPFWDDEILAQFLKSGICDDNMFDASFLAEDDMKTQMAISCVYRVGEIVFLSGWAVPSKNYDKAFLSIKGQRVGLLERTNREDVKKHYPYVPCDKCGFEAVFRCEKDADIEIELFHKDQKVFCKDIKGLNEETVYSYNDSKRILRSLKKGKNVFIDELDSLLNDVPVNEVGYRFFLYNIKIILEKINEKDMSGMMQTTNCVEDVAGKMWLCEQYLPWNIFHYPDLRIDKFYEWQRKQYNDLCKYCIMEPYDVNRSDDKNVVIMVDSLGSELLASTILEIEFAKSFSRLGYKVTIVVQDTTYTDEIGISSWYEKHPDSRVCSEKHREMAGEKIDFVYCTQEGFIQRKREAYSTIVKINPIAIVDISHNGLLVSSALYQKGYYVMHICISGFSSGALFSKYVSRSYYMSIEENKRYHSIDKNKLLGITIKVPYTYDEEAYSRSDYSIPDEAFILFTTGNRLKYEMKLDFLKTIKEILDENDRACWLVIGNNLGREIEDYFEEYIRLGKVILWGFEKKLSALYRMCDAFINPVRMGGGGSITMAMDLMKPVIMTSQVSDVRNIVLCENCVSNYREMIVYAKRLINDYNFYHAESEKFYRLANRDGISIQNAVEKMAGTIPIE